MNTGQILIMHDKTDFMGPKKGGKLEDPFPLLALKAMAP